MGNELDYLTQAFKLAVPLGSCPSTGVVGYALVITADGRKLIVRPGEHDDLFWALRDAGANFGIVIALEFA